MGRNHDPVTLHKYLYANVDPVNNIDPTGNFSLGSVGAAGSIAVTLMTIGSVAYDVFSFATGKEELTARNIGSAIIFNAMGGAAGKLLGLMSKRAVQAYKKMGCTNNSFISGTLVQTQDGIKPIEDIEIGDIVLSYNEETGEEEYQEVTHLIRGEKQYELTILTLSNGEKIESTSNHPYYVDGEWIEAAQIVVGDYLEQVDDKNNIQVVGLETVHKSTSVYNFSVGNNHNYYVGEVGVLVHNQNGVCVFDWASKSITNKLSPRLKKLVGGPGTHHVYLGFDKRDFTKITYVGITGDFGVRKGQHQGRSFTPTQITKNKLPKLLARAIEQAFILQYGLGGKDGQTGQLRNKINSIAENGSKKEFYKELVEWGQTWIKNNPL